MDNTDSDKNIERQLAVALKSEPKVWTPACLSPEQMIALAEHSLPETEATALMAHVALCARCRREYAETVELIQLAEEVSALQAQSPAHLASESASTDNAAAHPEKVPLVAARQRSSLLGAWRQGFSPGLGFALGAAAACVALYLAWVVPARVQQDTLASTLHSRNTQIARTERENRALQQELAALKPGQREAVRLAERVDRLSAQVKRQNIQVARLTQAERTLQQMPLPTPSWILARESGQLRGSGPETQTPQIVLIRPVNTAISETKPVLECRPEPGAKGYAVSLEEDGTLAEIPAPKPLSATRWQVETPLAPGKVYKWAVSAQRGSERLHSPFVKFYVLSEAENREVEKARHEYANSPLTLGVVYARLGMLAEAEKQFRAAASIEAVQPIARRWLQELEARRHQP